MTSASQNDTAHPKLPTPKRRRWQDYFLNDTLCLTPTLGTSLPDGVKTRIPH